MTDYAALVARLESWTYPPERGPNVLNDLLLEAAAAITSLSAENERLAWELANARLKAVLPMKAETLERIVKPLRDYANDHAGMGFHTGIGADPEDFEPECDHCQLHAIAKRIMVNAINEQRDLLAESSTSEGGNA